MSFSTVSFSNTNDDMRKQIRYEHFTNSTNAMDICSRKNYYTVYEYKTDGHILTNQFISSEDANDFVNQFCSSYSKVYIYKTECYDVFEPRNMPENDLTSKSETYSTELVDYNSEDDSDFDPNNCSDSETSDEEELSEEELSDEALLSGVDLSEMFFSKYGKGLLLVPPSNHKLIGQKYFLEGWWMSKKNGWFFKSDYEDILLELGAMKATVKSSKSSKSSKESMSTKESKSMEDLSDMTFTKYGKGYMVSTNKNDSRYGTKYLLSDVSDGGFWNNNAKGWFFRKTHFDYLKELGAQYIKSESNYETSDTAIIKPDIKKYGKGYLLREDSYFKYTGEDMNYYENGWYIPAKKGWFFKTDMAKAFMKKYNM